MPEEFIYIKHPEIDVLGGPVARSALPTFEARGWAEATPEEVKLHEEGKRQQEAELEALTPDAVDAVRKRADLDTLAIGKGVRPSRQPSRSER
jgi:hypothetical protein